MVEANGTTLAMYQIPPGIHFATHAHPFAELGVVLRGAGRCRLGGQVRRLRAGDSFYIPAGVSHDFTAEKGEPVVMLNVTVLLGSDEAGRSVADVEVLAHSALRPRPAGAATR